MQKIVSNPLPTNTFFFHMVSLQIYGLLPRDVNV